MYDLSAIKQDFILTVGTKVKYKHRDWVDGMTIFEGIENLVTSNIDDEYTENYLNSLQGKKILNGMEKAVSDYLDKNVEQPDFYTVEDIDEIKIIYTFERSY